MRWKTSARDSADPGAIEESILRNQVPFSCLRTCQPWGPDDDLVAPELCQRDRSCFQRDDAASGAPRVPDVA
jgi:hypothetical protein